MTLETLEELCKGKRVRYRAWGWRGSEARDELERALNLRLHAALRAFAENIGNFSVDPFSLLVCGAEEAEYSCTTETHSAREHYPDLPGDWIQIMEHAGEAFFFDNSSGRIRAFDSSMSELDEPSLEFQNLDSLVEWVIDEADAIESAGRFLLRET